jgi:hypothetical protein
MDKKWKRTRRCWGAQGPALDAYKEISQQILDLLNERDDLDEGEDGSQPWGQTCYMVGHKPDTARPTIIVHCRSQSCCKKIISHIRETQLWSEFKERYPAFGFGVATSAPRPIPYGTEASEEKSYCLEDVYATRNTDNLCGLPIRFGYPDFNAIDGGKSAMQGGGIFVHGVLHGLTVAHPLSNKSEALKASHTEALRDPVQEVEFLDDSDDEYDQIDKMVAITSKGRS